MADRSSPSANKSEMSNSPDALEMADESKAMADKPSSALNASSPDSTATVIVAIAAVSSSVTSQRRVDNNPLSPENLRILIRLLPAKDFVLGLQDDGQMNKNYPHIMKYSKVKKLSLKIYNHWQHTGLFPFTSNKRRDAITIMSKIIQQRKHIDKVEVLPALIHTVKVPV